MKDPQVDPKSHMSLQARPTSENKLSEGTLLYFVIFCRRKVTSCVLCHEMVGNIASGSEREAFMLTLSLVISCRCTRPMKDVETRPRVLYKCINSDLYILLLCILGLICSRI